LQQTIQPIYEELTAVRKLYCYTYMYILRYLTKSVAYTSCLCIYLTYVTVSSYLVFRPYILWIKHSCTCLYSNW